MYNMNRNIQVIIEPNHNLAIVRAIGILSIEDLISIFATLYTTDGYLSTTRIVTDFRGAKASIELADIEGVIDYISANNLNNNIIYNAILTDEPSCTAIAVLYQHASTFLPNYYCSVFNQIPNAARFIQIPKEILSDILQRYDITSSELVK
jgi:hypothetical protein